jgi:hypothetical protein
MHKVDTELKIIHQNLAMTKLKLMEKKDLQAHKSPFLIPWKKYFIL